MAKRITDKSKYKTSYKIDTWVGPAQYIAELICESAAKQRKALLPYEFWKVKPWKALFMYQVTLAYKLLKEYPAPAIIEAIYKTRNINSLASPLLRKNIVVKTEENVKCDMEKQEVVKEVRPSIVRTNILDKLKDL